MHLILLPGLDGSGDLFQPFISALPPQLIPKVVSYPTTIPQTYDDLVSVVNQALPRDTDFILLGESFGGPLALKVAGQSISNLRAVILCATFLSNPLPWSLKWVQLIPCSVLSSVVRCEIPTGLLRIFLAGSDAPQEILDLIYQSRKKLTSEVIVDRIQAVLKVDERNTLMRFPVPILYLKASHDLLVSPRWLDEMLRIRPNLQYAEVDSPHLLLQRKPEEAVLAITSFIESL